jgi:hypothetical protein
MKPCTTFQEELAVNASLGRTLPPRAAGHLRDCVACHEAYSELQNVAAVHQETSNNLRPFGNPAHLNGWFQRTLQQSAAPRIRWRVVGPAFAALVVVGLGLSVLNGPKVPQPSGKPSAELNPSASVGEVVKNDPTWHSLRHQTHMDDPISEPGSQQHAPRIAHYRLKDAYFEMQ